MKMEVLEAMRDWILRVCENKELATPEEIASLPSVAKVFLSYSFPFREILPQISTKEKPRRSGVGMEEILKPKFTVSLEAARINKGLSQEALARIIGVHRNTIANWEQGATRPSDSQLQRISEISGIPLMYISLPAASKETVER